MDTNSIQDLVLRVSTLEQQMVTARAAEVLLACSFAIILVVVLALNIRAQPVKPHDHDHP